MDPSSRPIRFRLFGFGGAGRNIISESTIESVAVGANPCELERCPRSGKIIIPANTLRSLAEIDPAMLSASIVPQSAMDAFAGCDMPVFVAGLGGDSGSAGIRLFSSLATNAGKTSIAVVSLPFSVESSIRRELAANSISSLRKTCDILISFENDKLASLMPNLPISKAFRAMNAIMGRPLRDFERAMTASDIQILKGFVSRPREYKLGIGNGTGVFRDVAAVRDALSSPWFSSSRDSVESAIALISSSKVDRKEIESTVKEISDRLTNADVLFGSYEDKSAGDKLQLTLLLSYRS